MFTRILAPVDGSAASNRGLKQAIQLAGDTRAKLTLLHVVDEGAVFRVPAMEYSAFYINEIIDDLVKVGKRVLANALRSALRQGVIPALLTAAQVEEFLTSEGKRKV